MSDAFEISPRAIECEAIALRALSTADAPAVYAYASDPAVYAYASDPAVAQFTLWPPHRSEESTREFLSSLSRPKVLSWAITPRTHPEVIGMVFFHSYNSRHQKAELAFNVSRSHWGRGIATEAARTAVRYAFAHLGLNRIEATCMPANAASRRVLEKIGMSREGTMRRSHLRHDGYHDMDLFSILRNEIDT